MEPSTIPQFLFERTKALHGLHERLREGHFGIDKQIQDLLDAFAPWYLFAETQMRPRVIGLWGMTGTGKSSLVRALIKEVGLEDRSFWLDAGECSNDHWMHRAFDSMKNHLDGLPFILVVDEFQRARVIDEMGIPVEEPTSLRRFWEFLDSGRVLASARFWKIPVLRDFTGRYQQAIAAGAEVKQGRVVAGKEAFDKLIGGHYQTHGEDWCIPLQIWDELRDLAPPPALSLSQFESKLSALDTSGVAQWLGELLHASQMERVLDASKVLVILLGNLDELYVSGMEPMAELDPEVLLHRHNNIGRAGVHDALLKLFRIEQVGRIGNSHVIFPPVGKATVDAIVQRSVQDLCSRLSDHCGMKVQVDYGLVDHLCATASIAVMGARPVVESTRNTVPTLLSQALAHPRAVHAVGVKLGVSGGTPRAELDLGASKLDVALSWGMQARTAPLPPEGWVERIAVHETGHLICGVFLRGKRPLQVCASTRDPRVGGFVVWDTRPRKTLLRAEIVPELAAHLGGWAAERLQFGPEGVGVGSNDDLERASLLALNMVKVEGMGRHRLHYAFHRTAAGEGFRTALPEAEEQASQWIGEAEAMAIETLQEHKALFERCVSALIDKGSLGMVELEELLGCTSEAQLATVRSANEGDAGWVGLRGLNVGRPAAVSSAMQ